jgi:hypothetical protein
MRADRSATCRGALPVPGMAGLLGWGLQNYPGEPRAAPIFCAAPIFSSTSREIAPRANRTKAYVQRHSSGVLFIDETNENTPRSALFVNRHGAHLFRGAFERRSGE